jgi:hypothetical protein
MRDDSRFASALRIELGVRSRRYARGLVHIESYGKPPVILFAPEGARHGNFFDPAFAAIQARPEWARRFEKVHTGRRSLPSAERKWRELDSSMSSDALLMNVFCTPQVAESAAVSDLMGVEAVDSPVFGWKAKVAYRNGHLDRTEVDMRWGTLLVEAKLTEPDFQTATPELVESYRDLEAVFDPAQLPRIALAQERRKPAAEFPEEYTQEEEYVPAEVWRPFVLEVPPGKRVEGYRSYQLIRNVLAAHATGSGFCVLHDARRPDLREAWFQVMAAVRASDLRTRLRVLTWQELAAVLPEYLQSFLDRKYGIVAPGKRASPLVEDGEGSGP